MNEKWKVKAAQQKTAERIGGHTYSSKAITEEIKAIMEEQRKEREKLRAAVKKIESKESSPSERLKALDKIIIPVLEGEVEIGRNVLLQAETKEEFESMEKRVEAAQQELEKKREERRKLEKDMGRKIDYSQ